MVKFTNVILSVALLLTGTLVNAMITNCKGSFFCGHEYHKRCTERTIEKLRHLLFSETHSGNADLWYPSGGGHIACLKAKKGSCCVRWNGHLANGTVSEALHFMDVLIHHGCLCCGSTMLDPNRPGEITVNYEEEKHPECDAKLCPGGFAGGVRPTPTWTPLFPTVETKTRSPAEQESVEAAAAASRSEAESAAAAAARTQSSSQSGPSSEASSTPDDTTAPEDTTTADNGDVTVTEKETETTTVKPPRTVTKKTTETMTVKPPRTVTKKTIDTVRVTREAKESATSSTGKTASKAPSMTTSVLGSGSPSEEAGDSTSSGSSAGKTDKKDAGTSARSHMVTVVVSDTAEPNMQTVYVTANETEAAFERRV